MSSEEQLQREWRESIREQLSKIDADVAHIKLSVSELRGANVVTKLGSLDERVRTLELHRARAMGIIIAGALVFNVLLAIVLRVVA